MIAIASSTPIHQGSPLFTILFLLQSRAARRLCAELVRVTDGTSVPSCIALEGQAADRPKPTADCEVVIVDYRTLRSSPYKLHCRGYTAHEVSLRLDGSCRRRMLGEQPSELMGSLIC